MADMPKSKPRTRRIKERTTDNIWPKLLAENSKRRLANDSDRLIAISAIATLFLDESRQRGDEQQGYVAGI